MDELKEIVIKLLKTKYIPRRSLGPVVAHNTIILDFKQILEKLGFEVILEYRQEYRKSKQKTIKGRIDLFATKADKSIALEYDAGTYWEIRNIRKLSEVNSNFILLIIGSGSIYNQYRNNIHKRLLRLKDKKGIVASLRLKETESVQNLIKFYNLDVGPQ